MKEQVNSVDSPWLTDNLSGDITAVGATVKGLMERRAVPTATSKPSWSAATHSYRPESVSLASAIVRTPESYIMEHKNDCKNLDLLPLHILSDLPELKLRIFHLVVCAKTACRQVPVRKAL